MRVQEALGELVGAAREGLLALSVGVGLGVLAELMEEEVDEVVGPKGKLTPGSARARASRRSWSSGGAFWSSCTCGFDSVAAGRGPGRVGRLESVAALIATIRAPSPGRCGCCR